MDRSFQIEKQHGNGDCANSRILVYFIFNNPFPGTKMCQCCCFKCLKQLNSIVFAQNREIFLLIHHQKFLYSELFKKYCYYYFEFWLIQNRKENTRV